MIVDERIEGYIRNLIPQQSADMESLKAYADNFLVPIVHPEVGTLLRVLCKIHKPLRILEVGTAIGYSALLIDDACGGNATIDTLELSPEMVIHARRNIEAFHASDRIRVYEGDAAEMLKTLEGSYDMIFIDAAKGQYLEYLDSCIPLMKKGTLLISDNVLFKGMVATNDLLVKRKVTLVKRLRTYLDRIMHHEQMDSTIIPIADGVALSVWKGHNNEDNY